METETISIASAVVVPPQDDIQERVKRRQPPSELSEASKRLRLSHDESGNDSGTTKDINDGSRATAERLTEEPSLRRKTGADEERKRGKRLFGALLGTIGKFQKETSSQRARSNAVKRREVEAKLEEKMKLQTEELDEQRKKDNENLNLRKRIERREFEERTMELRHNSLLAQANMLATSATPKLFYLPWKLLPSEEDSIQAQTESTNVAIEAERRGFQEIREKDDEELRAAGGILDVELKADMSDPISTIVQSEHTVSLSMDTSTAEDIVETNLNLERKETTLPKFPVEDESGKGPELTDIVDDRRNSDVGDMADIVEEGEEDTVIY